MRMLIRADAAGSRGAGHVMRSLAVGEEAVARGWQVTLSADLSAVAWIRPWVDELGVRLVQAVHDGSALAGLVGEQLSDTVLLDHYGFPHVMDAVHAAGARLVNFEDGTFGRRAADLSIDYQLGAEQCERPPDGSGMCLRGVAYAPIRAELRKARTIAIAAEPAERVAVLMGGTDAASLVHLVQAAIAEAGTQVAPVPRGRKHLRDLLSADAVVSAAGVSSYELCYLGVPTALLQVADNQSDNYRALVSAGAVVGLGTAEQARESPAGLTQQVARWVCDGALLASTATKARALVDGYGAKRIVDALEEFL